jgi:hypothetical protein
MSKNLSKTFLVIYAVIFIYFAMYTPSIAINFPKIDTEVMNILNKYNETVSKYEELNNMYNSLKDTEKSGLLENTKKSLDGQLGELKGYITDIKNIAKGSGDEAKDSLLEKAGNKLIDINSTLETFENELNKYKGVE